MERTRIPPIQRDFTINLGGQMLSLNPDTKKWEVANDDVPSKSIRLDSTLGKKETLRENKKQTAKIDYLENRIHDLEEENNLLQVKLEVALSMLSVKSLDVNHFKARLHDQEPLGLPQKKQSAEPFQQR